ncbi:MULTISPECIES: Ti-type conjugative transfer relaxase TraA [Sphingomonas]|jgi:Ti-type conjugative transfer relaxase TraA|uniref:Ti-type conjugative transfer relaxase TraA n=1 Tax=Sphingomonas TaxID=13687 RepID=UPI00254E169A|nr:MULTISPECIES: Ti-type conjugative transfer relaxase TraA [Sphingomonas]MDK8188312.1 Ti-type conjugative transfer relaxase TraA [Sphingomonas zeae]MDK8218213.1 Ti-type conjugative transfer relaxase TraA [Sphingomonas sp. UMB7805-LC452B]
MAIYHFSAKVISRANGSSAVASAAYRSASELHDERLGRNHDFSNKAGVIHSEVMSPQGAPERLNDRTVLWNEVEAGEKRKDAQLAREVEFSIPREMNEKQGVALARDFVAEQFVKRGMVADLNVHWDKAKDGSPKPHAHVMLSMRDVGPEGFGKKNRDWNGTELLKDWREAWSAHVNERMAELGLEGRIDHRSYKAQGIELEPQHKIGPMGKRHELEGQPHRNADDHVRIARENGDRIIADPRHALDGITRQQATFTTRDLALFAFRHSDGKEQFDRVMAAVRASPELVALGRDGRDQERFTSRDMIATEARLERAGDELARHGDHGVSGRQRGGALDAAEGRGLVLSGEQRDAFDHITGRDGLASVVGYAGTGKSAMLGVAREAWEREGYQVRGAALSGIAAENLEGGSGIASRTIASLEHGWAQGRDQLGPKDVLVVDEAGMIGTRQMERVLSHARDAGAKVVLVGDPEQLQAIEAGAAFRSITERHGAAEITEIRRQREDWQKEATRAFATGRTAEALDAYAAHGMVHAADTREAARAGLVDRWDRDRQAEPDKTRIMFTHTNAEVRELNQEARERVRASGELGEDRTVAADRGERDFAAGDRIMFLRNERSLGVKNGTLGTLERIEGGRMGVRLDGGRSVAFDLKDYAAVDHGYAATFGKSQGVSVDRGHVLATPGMDRHSSYVGMTRHRDDVQLHYGRDDFADQGRLARVLSRDRSKDMAGDYAPEQSEQDHARAFADRREIRFPERARQVVEKVRDKARGMFAGFRPKPGREQGGPINTGAMSALGDRSRERGAINTGGRSALSNRNPEGGAINTAALSSREMQPEVQRRPTREGVEKTWIAEHGRELAGVQTRAQRAQVRASGMYRRHETVRDDHARKQPLPPSGLFAALRRPSHEAAQASWEKTARGLQQRSTQLAKRLGKLKEYLGPVTGQRRHRGDELARARVERAHPYLTKLYDAVMREKRAERIRVQEQERERNRERQKERGRDDRGAGR